MRDSRSAALSALAAAANEAHRAAGASAGAALAEARAAGEALAAARRLCERGDWRAWVRRNFEGSLRTAQRYMRVARLIGRADVNASRVSLSPTAALKALRRSPASRAAGDAAALLELVSGRPVPFRSYSSAIEGLRNVAERLAKLAEEDRRAAYLAERGGWLADDCTLDARLSIAELPREVYFIEAVGTGRVKVGVAADVTRRLKQLSTGSAFPLRLVGTARGGQTLEGAIARRFRHCHLGGEWYQAVPELNAFIKAITKNEVCDETLQGASSTT